MFTIHQGEEQPDRDAIETFSGMAEIISSSGEDSWAKEMFMNPGRFAFLDKWAVEVIESWTPTAVELMTSPAFWRKRIDEQIEYIARNNGKVRPEVIDSALTILERCQSHYYGFSQAQRIEALANEIVESNNRDE